MLTVERRPGIYTYCIFLELSNILFELFAKNLREWSGCTTTDCCHLPLPGVSYLYHLFHGCVRLSSRLSVVRTMSCISIFTRRNIEQEQARGQLSETWSSIRGQVERTAVTLHHHNIMSDYYYCGRVGILMCSGYYTGEEWSSWFWAYVLMLWAQSCLHTWGMLPMTGWLYQGRPQVALGAVCKMTRDEETPSIPILVWMLLKPQRTRMRWNLAFEALVPWYTMILSDHASHNEVILQNGYPDVRWLLIG